MDLVWTEAGGRHSSLQQLFLCYVHFLFDRGRTVLGTEVLQHSDMTILLARAWHLRTDLENRE